VVIAAAIANRSLMRLLRATLRVQYRVVNAGSIASAIDLPTSSVYDHEMGMIITAPERTFTRARRCANCTHFETGEPSHKLWNIHRKARIDDYMRTAPVARLADMENPRWSPAEMQDARLQQLHQMDQLIAHGGAGVCRKGKRDKADGGPSTDFIHADFLCDRWTGIDGVSTITEGHDDKLGEELHEIADDRAVKKG